MAKFIGGGPFLMHAPTAPHAKKSAKSARRFRKAPKALDGLISADAREVEENLCIRKL
jgi:hypothetical protein